MSGYDDAGLLTRLATNLFHGWGYDFYGQANRLRADDQLVRAQVGHLLGSAQLDVSAAETAFRRARLTPPSRAQPFPDPAAVAGAQALERLAKEIGALIGRVQAAPVPAADRMTDRFRDEAETLTYLRDHDRVLVGQAALLRAAVEDRDGATLLADLPAIGEGLTALRRTLESRATALNAVTR